ncbi:uncharacterized protein LOC119066911 [Bradysia coprophila]|uniref:uncharacterized protein LOC119066911 n=1 Tax=Bradysia coprophila TaxID=38358 RepID=UPI00187D842F|nr:uncharacterized protein LOC119066911 [Bradysia coprophila]
MAARVDLNEIKNIPEDEFKQNLIEWVEQQDISKELQSKLRSDLITNFGKTALGRQIAVQYQQSQRMVLSSMVLVLNTLVAEFLYDQNCHFSLSVFSSEVPYKNVLPDFEKTRKFRFDSAELNDIMKALALDRSDHKTEILQMYKQPQERDGTLADSSLLFCIIKTLSQTIPVNSQPSKPQNDANLLPQSQEGDNSCHHCKNNPKKSKMDELNSKYYKHFYKYLELLSQHLVEISENTKKFKEPAKSDDQQSRSSLKICELNKRLDKITESLTNLSKSNRKGRKVTEMVKSITRLTNEVEWCSRNVAQYSKINQQTSQNAAESAKSPTRNYTEWLNQVTESAFGQRFVKNLELAQEKAIANEVRRIKEYFNEKYETTRKLIKFHYKQKTFEKFRQTMLRSPVMQSRRDDFNELIDEKLRLLKEKENHWKQNLVRASTQTMTSDEMVLNPSVSNNIQTGNNRVPVGNTNETTLPSSSPKIIPKAKTVNNINKTIELLNEPPRPVEPAIDNMVQVTKNRLHELEIESEQLDKSFHKYLKKQNEEKQFLTDDIDNVWQQYERTRSDMMKTFIVPDRSRKNVTTSIQCHENLTLTDPIVANEPIAVPRNISGTSQFKNPYKILHSNLITTGALNDNSKKQNANSAIPSIIVQEKEYATSADKISQIPVPMQITSIPKKSKENETKTRLRISTSNGDAQSVSNSRDTSPVISSKKAESFEVGQSQQSDTSIRTKGSEIVINSPVSIPSETIGNKFENALTQLSSIEKVEVIEKSNAIIERSAADAVIAERTKDVSSLFEKMEIENASKRSTSSESSVGRKISTGHKSSSSSDEFWK